MPWIIKKGIYQIWDNFSIELLTDITFQVNHSYYLKGDNGSGKTSFIRKLLIPNLQIEPEQQHILYCEQQIQSIYDVVNAYVFFQKQNYFINNEKDLAIYQSSLALEANDLEKRPLMCILDESKELPEYHKQLISDGKDCCLVFTTHHYPAILALDNLHIVEFQAIANRLSKVMLHE